MIDIAITGGSGFIGKHLLDALTLTQDCEIRVLTRASLNIKQEKGNVSFIEGNLLIPESLDALLEPGGTVINLAYLAGSSRQANIKAMENLADACARMKIKRLIHCSTAVVVGRVKEAWVDENTSCNPISEYEKTKLEIEKVFLEKSHGVFEVSILRPTAVFGQGGKNLIKMASELRSGNALINYTKSCLYYRRSMNLVCVENVVAALKFLLFSDSKIDREVFIVSEDDSHINNYHEIEVRFRKAFGDKAHIRSYPLPLNILMVLLFLSNKSIINPAVRYSDKKIAAFGFAKPESLELRITDFVNCWAKQELIA